MESHYTFFSYLSQEPNIQKAIGAILLGVGLLWLGSKASKKYRSIKESKDSRDVIPDRRMGLTGIFDLIIEQGFIPYHDSIMGKNNRRYLPLSASIFTFIFIANLIGLIPGMPAITTTVWVNVGMAIVVFLAFNIYGIRENGILGYLKHFCGPVVILAPLVFCIEILSILIRVLTLNLRLYWNITADHVVLGIFTDLTKAVVPVVFYFLGTFVCFMQAFIFTTLTMVYILLAVQHEEEAH